MRRRIGLFLGCGLLLPLVVTATASAQGSTLLVDDPTPTGNQVIRITGTNFTGAAGNSQVAIRLSTRDGQVLANPVPNAAGNIDITFPLPNLAPGWYLILATQTTTSNGRQRQFTPGRTRILVGGAPRGAGAGGAGGGGITGSPLGLVAGGFALVLLGAGAVLTARRRRTLDRPQMGS